MSKNLVSKEYYVSLNWLGVSLQVQVDRQITLLEYQKKLSFT